MIITPKEKPVVQKLNSYYIRIPKLIEHFQGEIGSGVVHFTSAMAEGMIFFDKDELLNGALHGRQTSLTGSEAVQTLLNVDETASYSLSVYSISPDEIYFWSSIPDAKLIYKDLSTEFTDLEGLIKKMRTEELTGVIEVVLGDGSEGGLLLLNNGSVFGGSYSWAEGGRSDSGNDQEILLRKSKAVGGIFHVSRLPSRGGADTGTRGEPGETTGASKRVVTSLEELLGILERVAQSRKSVAGGFQTALNRKFVEKADKYLFLDPFAAEFKYANRSISLAADISDPELWNGVVESVAELADELGLMNVFQENLVGWKKKYHSELSIFGFGI
ncbi:MAG: hypothetical protein ACOWWM_11640 [Desulfobacterales bacterium]